MFIVSKMQFINHWELLLRGSLFTQVSFNAYNSLIDCGKIGDIALANLSSFPTIICHVAMKVTWDRRLCRVLLKIRTFIGNELNEDQTLFQIVWVKFIICWRSMTLFLTFKKCRDDEFMMQIPPHLFQLQQAIIAKKVMIMN